jgi:2-oxo-4-hydroxy-4-carboxy-5-ureidoimidazoline decarboxylase
MAIDLQAKLRIPELNVLPREGFVEILGRIYEHSPWVAETVVNLRPFLSLDGLRDLMRSAVASAPHEKQMELIRSHPDLAGRLAQQGQLTPESTREQASAGLSDADPGVIGKIQTLNIHYRERFDFPFIICARLNKVDAILTAMQDRISNDTDVEIAAALAEIHKIAGLRLQDIISD